MNLVIEDFNDVRQVLVAGKINSLMAPEFEKALDEAIQGEPKHLIVNLKDVDYLSSAGLRSILRHRQAPGKEKQKTRLCRGAGAGCGCYPAHGSGQNLSPLRHDPGSQRETDGMSCLCLNLRSVSEDLETLSAFVEENALRAGLDEAQVKRIELVLEEATLNIIHHAYGGQGGKLELCCTPVQGGLEIRLVDEGPPFNPLEAPALEVVTDIASQRIGGMGHPPDPRPDRRAPVPSGGGAERADPALSS